VAIVNNLLFVWNLCIFGGLSGIGIFTAQFAGRKNNDGIRHTFRLMVLTGVILTALGLGVFLLFGRQLISLYLHGSETANINETLLHGHRYLMIMLAGLLPFAAAQIYSTVLRETGETRIPMRASLIAVLVNLIGNYVLIYGKFGFPAMGVAGAAAATVISRCTELLFLAFVTHSDPERYPLSKMYTAV
jgi:Na+-driven multidrug efflux pump